MDDDTLMREWVCGPFRLQLHELPAPQVDRPPERHTPIGYRFYHDDQLIFEGDEIGVPADQSLDGDQTVRGVLGFLALRPGGVEPDYFAGYTPTQLAWRRPARGGPGRPAGRVATAATPVTPALGAAATPPRPSARPAGLVGSVRRAQPLPLDPHTRWRPAMTPSGASRRRAPGPCRPWCAASPPPWRDALARFRYPFGTAGAGARRR